METEKDTKSKISLGEFRMVLKGLDLHTIITFWVEAKTGIVNIESLFSDEQLKALEGISSKINENESIQ